MATRIYDIQYECGCLESLDGGGGLLDCDTPENCKFRKVLITGKKVTPEMIMEMDKEIRRRNS